jgi:hypothetical protein
MPICEKGFMFEMSGSMTLHPETPGCPRTDLQHKLNDELRAIFRDGQPITEEHGAMLRQWAERGADTRPDPAEQRILDGVRELVERVEDCRTAADLAAIVALPDVAKRRDWLKTNRASASTMLETAIEAAQARMTPPAWDDADPGVAA